MTVSRVLNNQDLVKSSTRERIFDAMKALNFRPNGLARSLAGGQSLYIGLIYTNPSYFYLSELLFGALTACRERGHHVMVDQSYCAEELADPDYIEKRFFEMGVHAVLISPPLSEVEGVIETIENTGLDLVCVGIKGDGKRLCVSMDDEAAAAAIVKHLIDLGHQDIAIIEGPPDHKRASEKRRNGYVSALRNHKLDVRPEFRDHGEFTVLSGMEAGLRLLGGGHPPTAIFACNDDMAIGVVHAAYRLGLRVPEDVSVVGFDDIAMATSVWPPLTTVRQPIREMAIEAIELLEKKQQGEDIKSADRVLDFEIICRKSTAPPRAR